MNRYQTENATVKAEMPAHTRRMTAIQIVEYLREHFKITMLKDENGYFAGEVPANKTTAYMMAVSNAIFDPANWKNPIYAIFPRCGMEWAKAAIIWYHGAQPMESFVGVYSNGYACW